MSYLPAGSESEQIIFFVIFLSFSCHCCVSFFCHFVIFCHLSLSFSRHFFCHLGLSFSRHFFVIWDSHFLSPPVLLRNDTKMTNK